MQGRGHVMCYDIGKAYIYWKGVGVLKRAEGCLCVAKKSKCRSRVYWTIWIRGYKSVLLYLRTVEFEKCHTACLVVSRFSLCLRGWIDVLDMLRQYMIRGRNS
jgi:hypothetical protein